MKNIIVSFIKSKVKGFIFPCHQVTVAEPVIGPTL